MVEKLVAWQRSKWTSTAAKCRIKGDILQAYRTLIVAFPALNEISVEKAFRSGGAYLTETSLDFMSRNLTIFLPTPKDHQKSILMLSLRAQLTSKTPPNLVASFRLVIVSCGKHHECGYLPAVAYRFEYGEGRHAYYHVQLCKDVYGDDSQSSSSLRYPDWLPTRLPALPVKACDAASLLLCLLIGIYGISDEMVRELVRTCGVEESWKYITKP